MKSIFNLFLLLVLLSCKNETYSDHEKWISSENGDNNVLYKNSYKNGAVNDSITGVYFDQATEYSLIEKTNKAIKFYKKALELEPNNVFIINALGNEYVTLRKFKKANDFFEKAIELDSEFSQTYLNFGFSKAKYKDYHKAIELYKIGVSYERSGEKKAYFYDNISRAYYHLYEDDKAKLYNEKALELMNNEFMQKELLNFRKTLYKK